MSKATDKKRALRIAALCVVVALTAAFVVTAVYGRVAGNAMPMPFGIGAAVVLSGSMEPELSVGDLLIVARRGDYQVGDVIVFQNGRSAVTHRIVSARGDTFITQGDANNTQDPPITGDQIKGAVVLAIPKVGNVFIWIKTPAGTLTVLALAAWLLFGSLLPEKKQDDEVSQLKAEIRRLKQENDEK